MTKDYYFITTLKLVCFLNYYILYGLIFSVTYMQAHIEHIQYRNMSIYINGME